MCKSASEASTVISDIWKRLDPIQKRYESILQEKKLEKLKIGIQILVALVSAGFSEVVLGGYRILKDIRDALQGIGNLKDIMTLFGLRRI